jgi:hypothetical protein
MRKVSTKGIHYQSAKKDNLIDGTKQELQGTLMLVVS